MLFLEIAKVENFTFAVDLKMFEITIESTLDEGFRENVKPQSKLARVTMNLSPERNGKPDNK